MTGVVIIPVGPILLCAQRCSQAGKHELAFWLEVCIGVLVIGLVGTLAAWAWWSLRDWRPRWPWRRRW